VDSTSVVRFDASDIDPLTDGYQLVLSTCWPFEALTPGPDRCLVHATLIGSGGGGQNTPPAGISHQANGRMPSGRVATIRKSQ
jgi:hypothetical protein